MTTVFKQKLMNDNDDDGNDDNEDDDDSNDDDKDEIIGKDTLSSCRMSGQIT